jgi:hypothetical protein
MGQQIGHAPGGRWQWGIDLTHCPFPIGFGAGPESRSPMDVAVVVGMVPSAVLTLLVILGHRTPRVPTPTGRTVTTSRLRPFMARRVFLGTRSPGFHPAFTVRPVGAAETSPICHRTFPSGTPGPAFP